MSQFLQQNLLAAQYFRPNMLHGAVQSAFEGKSGYWRLFFYNMQEESLKRDKEKFVEQDQRQEATEGASQGAQAEPVVAAKARRAKRTRSESPKPRAPVTPFLLTPPARIEPTAYEVLAALPRFDFSPVEVKIQTQVLVAKIIQLDTERARRRKRRRDDELLLLLAA